VLAISAAAESAELPAILAGAFFCEGRARHKTQDARLFGTGQARESTASPGLFGTGQARESTASPERFPGPLSFFS